MTISGPGGPLAHICPPRHPPWLLESGNDILSRKYYFSIQSLLTKDDLGAWLASGPYLPSLAFPPAPQNLGMDTLSRKHYFSVQSLLTNDHFGAWLASGPYLPPGIRVASWGMFCVCLYFASLPQWRLSSGFILTLKLPEGSVRKP